jgi:hypothetical protein
MACKSGLCVAAAATCANCNPATGCPLAEKKIASKWVDEDDEDDDDTDAPTPAPTADDDDEEDEEEDDEDHRRHRRHHDGHAYRIFLAVFLGLVGACLLGVFIYMAFNMGKNSKKSSM